MKSSKTIPCSEFRVGGGGGDFWPKSSLDCLKRAGTNNSHLTINKFQFEAHVNVASPFMTDAWRLRHSLVATSQCASRRRAVAVGRAGRRAPRWLRELDHRQARRNTWQLRTAVKVKVRRNDQCWRDEFDFERPFAARATQGRGKSERPFRAKLEGFPVISSFWLSVFIREDDARC